jgi:N-acetylmuramoyl-L-alanine amidase
MRHWQRRIAAATVLVMVMSIPLALGASALEPQTSPFRRTWERTDRPVQDLTVNRTWMWGPGGFSATMLEPYEEAEGGWRVVQYFDKSRMEDATYNSTTPPWDVSNGLLVNELVSGRMQFGDDLHEQFEPATVGIAGDPDDTSGVTYAFMGSLLDEPATPEGVVIDRILTPGSASGPYTTSDAMAAYGITTAYFVDTTGHTVATPFWEFMNATGPIYVDGQTQTAPLFENAFYATGLPITEAYWAEVKVAGAVQDVLIQCFERRCLTYTPSNAPEWRVEMGNVGRHYYTWRYGDSTPIPAPPEESAPVIVLDPGHDVTSGGALGVEYADVMRTALATRAALDAAGYTVYLTRADNETILYGDATLMPANSASMELGYNQGYAHTTKALTFQPDLYVSIHYNGSDNPSAAGLTVYYCDYGGPQNAVLAGYLRDELLAALRSLGYEPPYAQATEDGAIGKSYGHLATLGNVYTAPFEFVENRLPGVPAVLTEALFESNPAERALILDDATHQALAVAYVRAVDRYFGR